LCRVCVDITYNHICSMESCRAIEAFAGRIAVPQEVHNGQTEESPLFCAVGY
jgi:hypothetical protein